MANKWIEFLKRETRRLGISFREAMTSKEVREAYKDFKKSYTFVQAIKPKAALRQKGKLVVGVKGKKEKTLDEELEELEGGSRKKRSIIKSILELNPNAIVAGKKSELKKKLKKMKKRRANPVPSKKKSKRAIIKSILELDPDAIISGKKSELQKRLKEIKKRQ